MYRDGSGNNFTGSGKMSLPNYLVQCSQKTNNKKKTDQKMIYTYLSGFGDARPILHRQSDQTHELESCDFTFFDWPKRPETYKLYISGQRYIEKSLNNLLYNR